MKDEHSKTDARVDRTISLSLPGGSSVTCSPGASLLEAARSAGIKNPLVAKIDGRLVDLDQPVTEDCAVEFITFDTPEGQEVFRHSASHVMAHAVMDLFPGARFAIGPAIEEGFYYDFELPRPLVPEDLEKIEQRMRELIDQDLPFVRRVLPKKEALALFEEKGQPYKIELIQEIPDQQISTYRMGEFLDLCRGPHVHSTGVIKACKLLSIAGAYWRGDERNVMLQRIYGTAFASPAMLKEHLRRLEEAKRRDHRKLGRELDLFSISDEAGAGLVIYHPKGALLRMLIEDFEKKEHLRRGYQVVYGPTLLKQELWEKSGHYDHYRENMYFTEVEGQRYGIKPMNCLAHMLIYKSKIRSYRDLPIRYFELGHVHRHEKSGVLHGLTRVRGFTQDDAHILCRPDQLNDEIQGVIRFVMDVMALFGFEYHMEISTQPEKFIGTNEDWERATRALSEALNDLGIPFEVFAGEGAFYGPKIDVKLKDALGRSWQCATIQCDFTLPERFDLVYVDSDGERKRPVMLHRVILGSLERFMGVLIEHFAGAFPVWLSPVQVKVLTITDRNDEFALSVAEALKEEGIRAETDLRNEKIGFKIREARMEKVPYMLVLGDREVEKKTVNCRSRDTGELIEYALPEFIIKIKKETDLTLQEVKHNNKIDR
ncbi:MAG: threonine--tRNA ligase [bacterium]